MVKSKRRHEQLGIPFGTAQNRLRKFVLFDVLRRHGENVCHQCGGIIESPDDLSIEHKSPWENIDPTLFWDIDNIAFSHLSCNIKAGKKLGGTGQSRKVCDPGMSWCTGCKQPRPDDEFAKNSSTWNGLQNECNDCRSKRRRSTIMRCSTSS